MEQPTSSQPNRVVGVSRSSVIWVLLAGVFFGVGYAASPLTVWFLGSVAVLSAWGIRGLSVRERNWVLGILTLAIVARLLLIFSLFLATEPFEMASFFWDGDGVYYKQRAEWIRQVWLGNQIAPLDYDRAFFRGYGWTSYLYVLAYVQYWFGEAPYAIHLFNVFLSLSVAVVLFRLIRVGYGKATALLGLLLLLFMPTPLLWSVSALKESLYVFLIMLGLVGTVLAVRGPTMTRRAVGVSAVIIAFATIDGVRGGGGLLLALGIVGGLVGAIATRRLSVAVLVVTLLPFVTYGVLRTDAIYPRIKSELEIAAVQHIGHVKTVGNSYKLLEERFYVDAAREIAITAWTPVDQVRYVVKAVASLIAMPLPWQARSTTEVLFLPLQIIWYLMVFFAVVGSVAGLRRDPFVTCMLVATVAIGAVAIAIYSGNIGTMVRLRDTLVPFVVWLSAEGIITTGSAWRAARWRNLVYLRTPAH